jgi:hypothetical protein
MKKLICILLFAASSASCGDDATKKIVEQLDTSYDLDGRQVELTCHVASDFHDKLIMNGWTTVPLVHSPMQQQRHAFATARIRFGKDEPNCIWMPEQFRLSEVEFYDSDGGKHDFNTQFAIKATVKYTHRDWEKATVAEPESPKKLRIYGQKTNDEQAEEARMAAEERRKATGDPNDYTFELIVDEIRTVK